MKARINKKPDFDRDYIETLIAEDRGVSSIISEYNTYADCIERRVEALFGAEAKAIMAQLYANDLAKNLSSRKLNDLHDGLVKTGLDECIPNFEERFSAMSTRLAMQEGKFQAAAADTSNDIDDDAIEKFATNVAESLDYALRQLEADEAAGEMYEKVDTSASRAALKKLDVEINAAEKAVSEAQRKLSDAQIKKTEADERVERATEKLRRAKQEAGHAASALDSARSGLDHNKSELEDLRKQREAMQREIDSIELPTFSIVPSGDCIVLKAVNYDVRKMDTLDAALKWSRRIGDRFTGLSDSDFIVMGRLFGILSKLKGKYKLSIDPSCTNALVIYNEFKTCFAR